MPRVVLPVVADGALMSALVAGGRLVPVVMVDMSSHPEVEELVRVHRFLGQGDCLSAWGKIDGGVALRLTFQRPIELEVAIAFQVPARAGLVDQVVNIQAFFLQHGELGDHMTNTLHYPRLLIETPKTGFEKVWEPMVQKLLEHRYRSMGLSRREARSAAQELLIKWRRFSGVRMPSA
ncbi:hypothetical protein [uncultured Pseudokineococcus sp.]|uniref:hypothetical protein n=1 Tax=uncultured Pseudokineococcus sp. TaxID=1642928 RepID=UPI0026211248|nr:hypothetical protein [uncultured Pseudokineococcus sp.]